MTSEQDQAGSIATMTTTSATNITIETLDMRYIAHRHRQHRAAILYHTMKMATQVGKRRTQIRLHWTVARSPINSRAQRAKDRLAAEAEAMMAGQIAERGRGCVGEGRPLSHSPALAARCATLLRSSYSIASSARLSNDWGKAMPSAFAVLRLIMKSYLIGACTAGRPASRP